jgi:hypothetical protein
LKCCGSRSFSVLNLWQWLAILAISRRQDCRDIGAIEVDPSLKIAQQAVQSIAVSAGQVKFSTLFPQISPISTVISTEIAKKAISAIEPGIGYG